MSLDNIIGMIIIPLVFLWLGAKIYKHEKENLDPLFAKVKGWFIKKDEDLVDEENYGKEYQIEYRGADY